MIKTLARWTSCLSLLGLPACGAAPDGAELPELETTQQSAVLAESVSIKTSTSLVAAPTQISTAKVGTTATRGNRFSAYESFSAALGSATLDCLGTSNPRAYAVKGGILVPTFSNCRNEQAAETIKNLLAFQKTDLGRAAAKFMTATWARWAEQFPYDEIKECPAWKKVSTINPPTRENVGSLKPGQIGKENYVYAVSSRTCGKNAECTVSQALQCAGGFGSQFLIGADYEKGAVTVDPVYWLLNISFAEDANPFLLTPGYYHGMAGYGAYPGAEFGAPNRAGEYCSKWLADYLPPATNAVLVPVDCGGGYYCMSMCK